MAKKNMGDSGIFGDKKTMSTIPNSNYKGKPALTGIAKARSVGGKALAKGIGLSGSKLQGSQSMPSTDEGIESNVGAKLQGSNSRGAINQGNFQGQRSLKVRRTSDGYMRK